MLSFLALALFKLFFHPVEALRAADLKFVFIDKIYALQPTWQSQINSVSWKIRNQSGLDFLLLHVRFDFQATNIAIFPHSPTRVLLTNAGEKIINSNGVFKINEPASFILVLQLPNREKLREVLAANHRFFISGQSDKGKLVRIRFFSGKRQIPVFILPQPREQALRFELLENLADSLVLGLGQQRIIGIKLAADTSATVIFATYRQAKAKAKILRFSRHGFQLRDTSFVFRQEGELLSLPWGKVLKAIPDSAFVMPGQWDSSLILRIRYATEDNFTGKRLYKCSRCWLRYEVAKDLLKASRYARTRGLRLILYDCYRPPSVQRKMWQILPKHGYLAPPWRGSMHNRGTAIDVSLADSNGNELDMGTDFDFFGPQAWPSYPYLSEEVKRNRRLLASILMPYGFRPIRTEWWHFYHLSSRKYRAVEFNPCY